MKTPILIGFAFAALACAKSLPSVTIAVTPQSVSLGPNGTRQFDAQVSGTSDRRVIWSVQQGAPGGTVDANGLYTAPSTAGAFDVVATSVADPSKSASSRVSVSAPPIAVTIDPRSISLVEGTSMQFTATVANAANQAVVFSVQEAGGGTVIADTGVYTAPSTPGTFHVVATSVADATVSDTATVAVRAPAVVTISPKSITVRPSATIAFSATVTGPADTNAAFSVVESGAGSIVASTGVYTAPAVQGGPFHVKASSVAEPGQSDLAEVTVAMPIPAGLTAAGECAGVTLSWIDDGSGAYLVKRGGSAAGPFTTQPGTPALTGGRWTFEDTSLLNGTRYFYQVIAHDPAAGDSAPATADATTALAAPAFSPTPSDGTVSWGETQVSMLWSASAAPANATFLVSRSLDGSSFTPVVSGWPHTSVTDVGLSPSTHYDYRVQIDGPGMQSCQAILSGTTGGIGSAIQQSNDSTTTWVTESGNTTVPDDFSSVIYAYTTFPSWLSYPGLMTADGRFTIPNVPQGWNTLALAGTLLSTMRRTFDLTSFRYGRRDDVNPSTPTPITATVSGLQPWTTGDHLELASLGGYFLGPLDDLPGATGIPAASATSASITAVNDGNYGSLIEPSKGDEILLSQLAHASGTPFDYQTIQRACTGSLPGDMTDGAPATVTCENGSDMVAPPTTQVHVDWAQSAADALAAQAAPAGVTPTRTLIELEIDAILDARDQRSSSLATGFIPRLAIIYGDGTTDFSETLTVGDPFTGPRWSHYYQVRINYTVPYTAAPTASCPTPTPSGLDAYFRQGGPISELEHQITPEIGVLGEITMTKLAPITRPAPVGSGSPVQVSWGAPPAGANWPTQYRIDLFKLGVDGSCATTFSRRRTLWVDGELLGAIFPPSIFSSGKWVAQVRALWMPDELPPLSQPGQFFGGLRFAGTFKSAPALTY